MEDITSIKSGMPLHKGDKVVIRGGYALVASGDEKPVAVCTVDCSANVSGILDPVEE